LGHFATGVAVVTAHSRDGRPTAMTINSFASVSLTPPLVLWSIDRGSECFDTFNSASGFGVHILSQSAQDLSRRFSRKDNHDLLGGEYTDGLSGAPILTGLPVWFDCRTSARHDGGDHVILVGEVLDLSTQDVPTDVADHSPLLFYRGAYRRLADPDEAL